MIRSHKDIIYLYYSISVGSVDEGGTLLESSSSAKNRIPGKTVPEDDWGTQILNDMDNIPIQTGVQLTDSLDNDTNPSRGQDNTLHSPVSVMNPPTPGLNIEAIEVRINIRKPDTTLFQFFLPLSHIDDGDFYCLYCHDSVAKNIDILPSECAQCNQMTRFCCFQCTQQTCLQCRHNSIHLINDELGITCDEDDLNELAAVNIDELSEVSHSMKNRIKVLLGFDTNCIYHRLNRLNHQEASSQVSAALETLRNEKNYPKTNKSNFDSIENTLTDLGIESWRDLCFCDVSVLDNLGRPLSALKRNNFYKSLLVEELIKKG